MKTHRIVLRASARLYQRISAQLILLAGAVGLVWFLLYFTVNSSYAVQVFDGTFNSTIKGRVLWGRVSWGPLPWQVEIHEAALIGAHGRPIITAEAVRVQNFALLELARGPKVAASGITVVRPVIRLTGRVDPASLETADGASLKLDLPEMFEEPGPPYDDGQVGGPPPLDFDDVEVVDATFTLDFPSVAVEVSGVDIEAARFGMVPPSTPLGQRVMSMGARRVTVDAGEVRVLPGAEEGSRPIEGSPGTLRFPFAGVEIEYFRWFGEQFTVARLAGTHRDDRLLVTNYWMRLDGPEPWMAARVHLSVDEVADHLAQFGVSDVRGPAVVTVSGRGEIDAFAGRVEVAGDRLALGPLAVGQYRAALEKSADDHVVVEALELNGLDGRVKAVGGFDLGAGRGWADVWLRGVDVTALPVDLPPDVRVLAGGALRGPVTVFATDVFGEPVVTASADLTLERRAGPLYGLGRRTRIKLAGARLEGTRVDVQRLEVDGADVDVSAAGFLDGVTLEAGLAGKLRVDDLAAVSAALELPLAGEVDVSWRVTGALNDPTVRATVEGRALAWADLPAADVKGKLDFVKGWLEFRDFYVDARRRGGGDARVRGKLGVARPGLPLRLEVDARGIELSKLSLPVDVGGTVGVKASLRGTASKPAGAVEARVMKPRWEGLAFERLDIDAAYDGRELVVETLTLRGADGAEAPGAPPLLSAQGAFTPRTGAYSLTLAVDRAPLSLVEDAVPSLASEGRGFPLTGAVSLALSGEGRLAEPTVAGRVTLHEVNYDGISKKAIDGRLDIDAGEGRVKLVGSLLDRLAIDLAVPLAPGGPPAVGSLTFAGLEVEELIELPESVPLETLLTGRVTAQVDLFGGAPPEVVAELASVEASYELGGDRFEVRTPQPVRLRLANDAVAVEQLAVEVRRDPRPGEPPPRGPGATLAVGGGVSLGGEAPRLALTVGGELDLSTVQPFATSVFTEVRGRARLDLQVAGALTAPVPSGTVDLVEMGLVPRSSVVGGQIELARSARLYVEPMVDPAPIGICAGEKVPPRLPPVKGAFSVALQPTGEGGGQTLELIRDEAPVHIERLRLEMRRFVPDRIEVRLDAEDLALNVPRTLRATLDAKDLDVELCQHPFDVGPPRMRLRVGGEATVQRGEYIADITSASDINRGFTDNLRGATQTRTVSVFERVPLLKQLYFDDFRATCDGDFYIRNQVTVLALDLELRFGLTLNGLLTDRSGSDGLKLSGQMAVQPDSQLVYARRPFEVTTGSVIFGSDPIIDAALEATHTFRLRTDDAVGTSTTFDQGGGDIRLEEVTLAARFRLVDWESNPDLDIEMSSNSGLSSYEIAVLVLTGSLPDALGGAAGAQPATEVLLGPLLGLIERPLEDTLDVDLSLTPASSGTLFIDADKLLSRRLRLYSRTLVGDEDGTVPQQFGLEYRLNNAATAELSNEQAGNLNSTAGRLRLRLELD